MAHVFSKFLMIILFLSGIVFLCIKPLECLRRTAAGKETNQYISVIEHQDLAVSCDVIVDSDKHVTWTKGFDPIEVAKGMWLNKTNVSRKEADIYTCSAHNGTIGPKERKYFIVEVLYPAKILEVSFKNKTFTENSSFSMSVSVEGLPLPDTTFVSLTDGRVIFQNNDEEGKFNIVIERLTCSDSGEYLLSCNNNLKNDSRIENIIVLCAPRPDPSFNFNTTITPCLGDTARLEIRATGYPQPSFSWLFNGSQIHNHTDQGYSSVLTISRMTVDYYGQYTLKMKNAAGKTFVDYLIKPDGPPEPVYSAFVTDITTTNATLHWAVGYNYNSTQTFVIFRIVNNSITEVQEVNDTSNGRGGALLVHVLTNLTSITYYNMTIAAKNGRGYSPFYTNLLTFETEGAPAPDDSKPVNRTFTPRLGDSVELIMYCVGNPVPTYIWLYNGKQIKSINEQFSSIVLIEPVTAHDFGTYTLVMSNTVQNTTVYYNVIADGPPEPVYDVNVTDVSTSSATLCWIAGFNYNSTQTFLILLLKDNRATVLREINDTSDGHGGATITHALTSLTENTKYNLTVVARNDRGNTSFNTNCVTFMTEGAPAPDHNKPVNTTITPRLGDSVTLIMYSVGNPQPTFKWMHDGKQIISKDENFTTTVAIESVTVEDYGIYTLTMSNKVNITTENYQVIAEGPPEAVAEINATNISQSSVTLSWTTGYNYNRTQEFVVKRYEEQNSTDLHIFNDTTDGQGGAIVHYVLNSLASDTIYNITVEARSERGRTLSNDFIVFNTLGVPMPNKLNSTFRPRLGETTLLQLHCTGYPAPNYTWWHNGKPVDHTDSGYSSNSTIIILTKDDFGDYLVVIQNEAGCNNYTFQIKADGPPDPPTNLSVQNITDNSVNLTWLTGFDYNSSQTFNICRYVDNHFTVLTTVAEKTVYSTPENMSVVLVNLNSSTFYNVSLLATNSKGHNQSTAIQFNTTGPNPTPTPQPHTSNFTNGQIAGISVGSVAFALLIIMLVVIYLWLHRRSSHLGDNKVEIDTENTTTNAERFDDAASLSLSQ